MYFRSMGKLRGDERPREASRPLLASIRQRLTGDIRVVIMARRARLDGEFDAHVAEALAMAPAVRAVFVVEAEPGANLDAAERRKLISAGLFKVPAVVLTESQTARLIMTAVRWMGNNVAGFAAHQFVDACNHLGVGAELRPRLLSDIREMTAELFPAARGVPVVR
jgi:hypothetical protein